MGAVLTFFSLISAYMAIISHSTRPTQVVSGKIGSKTYITAIDKKNLTNDDCSYDTYVTSWDEGDSG